MNTTLQRICIVLALGFIVSTVIGVACSGGGGGGGGAGDAASPYQLTISGVVSSGFTSSPSAADRSQNSGVFARLFNAVVTDAWALLPVNIPVAGAHVNVCYFENG